MLRNIADRIDALWDEEVTRVLDLRDFAELEAAL